MENGIGTKKRKEKKSEGLRMFSPNFNLLSWLLRLKKTNGLKFQ